MKFRVIILGLLLFTCAKVQATHIAGGEIFYDCLGGNDYRIVLRIYRDCSPDNTNNTGFDDDANISFFDAANNLITNLIIPLQSSAPLSVVTANSCYQPVPYLCIEVGEYRGTINLPGLTGGYQVVHQRCCRNPQISNLSNPDVQGSSYTCFIPDPALAVCNSSARFVNTPTIAFCKDELFTFDHSAIDPDGDLLVYSLCNPLKGGSTTDPAPSPATPPPYPSVNWMGGFSANNPITGSPALSINANGMLTINPTQYGEYTVGICVSEYRNGTLINTVRRDFLFTVADCERRFAALVAAQSPDNFCGGLNFEPTNQSIRVDTYLWDFGETSSAADQSTLESPSYTYSDTGTYNVRLIANPGWTCADTTWVQFRAYPPIAARFTTPPGQCLTGNSFDLVGEGNFGTKAQFLWNNGLYATPPIATTLNQISLTFADTGHYPISLTISDHGCTEIYQDTILVYPHPTARLSVPNELACVPYTLKATDWSLSWTPLSYYWDFGDGNSSTEQHPVHVYEEVGSYIVSLSVEATTGCAGTSSLAIESPIVVYPIPTADFTISPMKTWIFEPEVTFWDESVGSVDHLVYLGNGDSITDRTFTYSYPNHGYFDVSQVVHNIFGCPDTKVKTVYIIPVHLFYAPNAFTPDQDGINDLWLPRSDAAKTYELSVYNRWGERIWVSNTPNEGWNGIPFGAQELAPPGVYVYMARIVDLLKDTHVESGFFTLIR